MGEQILGFGVLREVREVFEIDHVRQVIRSQRTVELDAGTRALPLLVTMPAFEMSLPPAARKE